MSFIDRLSITKLLMSSSVAFTLLVTVFVIKDTDRNYAKYSDAQQDITLLEMLDRLEKVAHHHAVERGLSAGFLGKPSLEAKAKVDKQRVKADTATREFSNLIIKEWPEEWRLPQKTNQLSTILTKKTEIRSQIDAKSGASAFAYYSLLNQVALDTAQNLALKLSNKNVSEPLLSAISLAKIKERLGQIRGKLNGALANQKSDALLKREIARYNDDIELLSASLSVSLDPKSASELTRIRRSSNAQTIAKVIQSITAPDVDFGRLPHPSDWFATSTAQIGEVKALLDKQWRAIRAEGLTQQSSAVFALMLSVVLSIIAIAVILAVNIVFIGLLKRQLTNLKLNLGKIAEHGDLTVDLTLQSENELGAISRSIHLTIAELQKLVVGLRGSISEAGILSDKLKSGTDNIVEDAQMTQEMARSIATAVEEMSQTSQEIAHSAAMTLEASKNLDVTADDSLKLAQKSKGSIQTLSGNMNTVQQLAGTMEQQVTDIGGLLDMINNLSEQTNLLALNAAIEAARAGEHGRGFAVVADEVRSLAKSSRSSSDKISTLLQDLQQVSVKVVEGIRGNTLFLDDVLADSATAEETSAELKRNAIILDDMSSTVSAAAEEQSMTSQHVSKDVVGVQDAASHEYELALELKALYAQSELTNTSLSKRVERFVV